MKRKAQNSVAVPVRRGPGKPFAKGGDSRRNAGGRPASEREVVEACRAVGLEMVELLTKAARRGNPKAAGEVLNRAYGKAKQIVKLSGADDEPIKIEVKVTNDVDPAAAGQLLAIMERTGLLPQSGAPARIVGGADPEVDPLHPTEADAAAGRVPADPTP